MEQRGTEPLAARGCDGWAGGWEDTCGEGWGRGGERSADDRWTDKGGVWIWMWIYLQVFYQQNPKYLKFLCEREVTCTYFKSGPWLLSSTLKFCVVKW